MAESCSALQQCLHLTPICSMLVCRLACVQYSLAACMLAQIIAVHRRVLMLWGSFSLETMLLSKILADGCCRQLPSGYKIEALDIKHLTVSTAN